MLSTLAACSAKYGGTVKSGDAARWLYRTCGISFAQNPVVVTNAAAAWRRPSGAMSGTVLVPETEMAAALEALRMNRSLHIRGQSESRYSYESYPEATPEQECELDTSLHVLYFRYRE